MGQQPSGRGPRPALLERERELDALRGFVLRAERGEGVAVLLEGPAGIGKTRLLCEAVDFARERDVLVRKANCGELERDMPFGVVRQLLEPVLRRCSDPERAALLGGSAKLATGALGLTDPEVQDSPSDPLGTLYGLYWLVANVAERRPVVFVVDDAHWADRQSLQYFDYLARRLDDLPLLVILGVRSGEPGAPPELERLRVRSAALQPQPLTHAAVHELIAARFGSEPSADLSAACWRATVGNPFFVTELLHALAEADSPRRGLDEVAATDMGPANVARYVLVRLERFGTEAVALGRAVSVLGGSPQLRHAGMLAGLSEDRAREIGDALRRADILAPGFPLDFVHPLVRQAIYREIAEGERSTLHRRAAEILDATGATAREVAPHLMACAPNGEQWVVWRLAEAAWQAIRAGAFDAAEGFLRRALAEPPEDEEQVVYALGRCMLQIDPVEAAQRLMELAQRTRKPQMQVRALRDAAQAFSITDWSSAARCYLELIEILPKDARETRLVAEAERYLLRVCSGGTDDQASRRITAVAARLRGDTDGERLAREALAHDRFFRSGPVGQVIDLCEPHPEGVWGIRTVVALSAPRLLARCGAWDEAHERVARARDQVRALGLVVNDTYYTCILSEINRLAGRLVDAEAEARTAVRITTAAQSSLNPGMEGVLNLILSLLARGEVEEAAALAADMDLSAGVREIQVVPWPLEIRGYLRLAQGDLEGGTDDLLLLGEGAEIHGFLNPTLPPWRQEAAPPLAALGRTRDAQGLVSVAEDRARTFGAPHAIGGVLRARALIEPRKRQIRSLEASVAALEERGPPHELARSLGELGAALRRDGRRSEARAALRRALDLAHRCGARGLEERARQELGATGARPRRALLTGPSALTATEWRIAEMAAKGLSNPQIAQSLFVTSKTVENHLGRIYPKLGINSRTRIAKALAGAEPAQQLAGDN